MNDEPTKKPPYLAYVTFKNFLASLKAGVLPSRIDKSLMPGQSGATQSYLMSTLRFFGLLDQDDAPSKQLEALVHGTEDERKKVWKEVFAIGYGPMFGSDLDFTRFTSAMLSERFVAQGLAGETARKSISFFTAAAQDAGIALPAGAAPNKRGPRPRGRKSKEASKGNGNGGAVALPVVQPASKTMREMLLDKFPPFNPEWTPEIQAKWFQGFEQLMGATGEK